MPKLVQQGELKQTLKITASMQQSISMLQMSSLELNNFSTQELAKNPFLEEDTNSEEKESQNVHPATLNNYGSRTNSNSDDNFFENIAAEKSLRDHIAEQINIEIHEHRERLIAYYLLDSLQSNGYLKFDPNEVALILKCSKTLISKVLQKLQTFDPPGIFARNLQECLKLQLYDKGFNNKKILYLIDNLDLLANGELKKLTQICEVNIEELKRMITEIKNLNPKPANGFLIEQTLFKIPDVILTIDANKTIKLEINQEVMPKLKLNHEYYLKVKSDTKLKQEKDFMQQELSSASNIIRGIEQRARTILKVASTIVEEQIDFFTRGIMYLKPLTLNTIAAMTNFNESTISRSTANKYIATPTGIYELKYFFSSSVANTKFINKNVSSTKVKEIIKQIIINEEPSNVLSDDEIALELQKFNISIARRTVAKYRESVGFSTSATRKRQYALAKKLSNL